VLRLVFLDTGEFLVVQPCSEFPHLFIKEVQMRHRVPAVILLVAVVLAAPFFVVGQAPSGTKAFEETAVNTDAAIKAAIEAAKAAAVTTNWTPPRTPWGDPDLQGYYFNHSGYTPLERPRELAGKAFYTEEEALAAFKKAVEADADVDPRVVHYDWKEYGMDAWQSGVRPNLRTSLIVDPPDGRIPPLTPEAQKRQADAAAAERAKGIDVTSTGLYTRCITGNGGPPRVPGGVTAESEIIQTPGYVVIVIQSNNDARIIPLDERPHLPQSVGQWLGDARGRWEGNTLVVETTNFHKDRNWRGSRDGMKLVERFTLVGPKTLRYEFTVNDPTTWTRPWSIDSLLPKIDAPIYEFACHEQNYGLINWAIGSQIREAEAGKR
jgi:hypothetical protein